MFLHLSYMTWFSWVATDARPVARLPVRSSAQWRRQRSKGARSFQGQKILQPGHPNALFLKKSWRPLLSSRPQNTGRQRRFTVKIIQIKRSDMVIFLFSVHTIIEAKQYAGQGRAEQGLEPGRWIFQPGHLTGAPWCSAATVIGCGNVVSSSRSSGRINSRIRA